MIQKIFRDWKLTVFLVLVGIASLKWELHHWSRCLAPPVWKFGSRHSVFQWSWYCRMEIFNRFCKYVMLCAIWHHLYNFKNVKNTHGAVLCLVKLQAKTCNFTKSYTLPWVFVTFLNCTNGTKSRKASHIY